MNGLHAGVARLIELIPFAERLSSAAAAILLVFHALRRKPPMSDLPDAPVAAPVVAAPVVAVASNSVADAPVQTAPAETPVGAPDHIQVIAAATPAIVQAVTTTPGVEPNHAYMIAANVIGALANELPAILQVARASTRTSTEVGLGFGLLAAILQAFAPRS